MSGRVGVIAVLVLVICSGAGPVAGAAEPIATGSSQSEPVVFQQDQIDADEVRLDVALEPNGTAEWTLEFWVRLDDDERTEAFESLREDIQEDPDNYTGTLAERMDQPVSAASNATGREMRTDGFTVETEQRSLAREYGVVRYTFDWHGFAAVEGDELRAGDAIEGIYLDEGTRLLVEWPEGYEPVTVAPEPDDERDRMVLWRGDETEFVAEEPRVVLSAAGSGPGTATIAVVGFVAVGLVVSGIWWYRNRSAETEQDEATTPASERDADSGSATAIDATADGAEPETEAESEAEPRGDPQLDSQLLSNEEKVVRLLESRGGRMKQQTVVAELGWTDAKTSKVVTSLREEGDIESFRLGRENVLSLPDATEPGEADSGRGRGAPGAESGGDDGT